jgi:hypothetical protein
MLDPFQAALSTFRKHGVATMIDGMKKTNAMLEQALGMAGTSPPKAAPRRIYLAGAMRGRPRWNWPLFENWTKALRAQGYDVVSPVELDQADGVLEPPEDGAAPPDSDSARYLLRDLEAITTCDAVVVLPDSADSRGVQTEVNFARAIGKQVLGWQDPQVGQVLQSAQGRPVSPTGGEKETKLERHDLIPPEALKALAEHYGRNCRENGGKYDDRNWERGYPWSLSYAALQRHLRAFWSGEDQDLDSLTEGQRAGAMRPAYHLDAVLWHAAALRTFQERFPEFDDRPARLGVGKLRGPEGWFQDMISNGEQP